MTGDSTSSPHSIAGPVMGAARVEAIDALRGFAVLGIFVMNITGMAFPFAAYFNPMVYGGPAGLNYGAWVFAHLFFDLKMMGIFSMLFGAGVVLMTERADAMGRSAGKIYYRRILWLLAFGLVHAYIMWHGDILVTYAICGLLLYLFRHWPARILLISGLFVLTFGALLFVGGGISQNQLRSIATDIETKAVGGGVLTPRERRLRDQWHELKSSFRPTREEIDETIRTMRGNVGDVLQANVRETYAMHTQAVPFMLLWRALALMLLGMGLVKSGVFTAQRSPAFYNRWMIVGFGFGMPIVAIGIWQWRDHAYDFVLNFLSDGLYNYVASVLVSMAYVGAIMRLCQAGTWPGVRRRLSAVGRMALTNYLLQTIVGVSLFYGYGLALFGRIDRFDLWWFILAVWALQLTLSPWWLRRYRFGPAEWLWRTLTYGRKQPMRITPGTE